MSAAKPNGLSETDFREMAAKLDAARAMLAALKVAWHEMRHTTATRSSFTDALDAADAAIAQAEAAGIKAEG